MSGVATISEDEYNDQGELVRYFKKLNPKSGNGSFNSAYKVILSFLHSVHWDRLETNVEYVIPRVYHKSH